MTVERKHQMVKIRAGDWLLLSNDGKTLWRVYRYDEHNGESWWASARYDGTPTQALNDDELEHAWDRWVTTEYYLETRQEAIDEALRRGT
jgi:hypothetical protein